MSDDLDLKDENDEADIDLTAAPLVDDEDEVLEVDTVGIDEDEVKKPAKKVMDEPDTESLDDLADEEEEDDLDEFEPEIEGNYEV